MSNRHVEIHDPLANHNHLVAGSHGPKSTSDADSMGDTVEFRILMAYAKRRRPKKQPSTPNLVNGDAQVTAPPSPSPQTPTKKEEKKNKTKKKLKFLRRLFMCRKPQIDQTDVDDTHDVDNRCFIPAGENVKDELEELEELDELDKTASRLTEIADEIPFVHPEVETDSPEDVDENVERMIGLLLRDAGDRLNEEEQLDGAMMREIFWNYPFFEKLIKALLTRMGLMTDPNSPGPQTSPKTHIAVTCEVTSRLSAADTLPANRMLSYGAQYLQQYFSSWAQQQGGYEAAFHEDDDDEVQ